MVNVFVSRINFFQALLAAVVSLKTTIPAYSSSVFKMENSNYDSIADNASNRIIRSTLERSLITTGNGKIFMIVNNRYLQIFADGAVNGTDDEKSDYGE